jgi:hypothetical protein
MIKLTIILLLTTSTPSSLEQKACDYFFASIFKGEYPNYKVIEFDNRTDTTRYWGIVHKCKNWDDKTKAQIVSKTPDKSTQLTATTTVRIKKRTKNSGRLQIGVWSKIKVGDSYFVLIGTYRKLRFAEYFLIELDKEGKILGTCKQGEII